jgi:hypothetical protein
MVTSFHKIQVFGVPPDVGSNVRAGWDDLKCVRPGVIQSRPYQSGRYTPAFKGLGDIGVGKVQSLPCYIIVQAGKLSIFQLELEAVGFNVVYDQVFHVCID